MSLTTTAGLLLVEPSGLPLAYPVYCLLALSASEMKG